MYLHFLVLNERLNSDVDVAWVEFARVNCLTTLVLASSDMKLELSIVELLMVAIEGTRKHCATILLLV